LHGIVRIPQDAVQLLEFLCGHVFAAFDDCRGPGIG